MRLTALQQIEQPEPLHPLARAIARKAIVENRPALPYWDQLCLGVAKRQSGAWYWYLQTDTVSPPLLYQVENLYPAYECEPDQRPNAGYYIWLKPVDEQPVRQLCCFLEQSGYASTRDALGGGVGIEVPRELCPRDIVAFLDDGQQAALTLRTACPIGPQNEYISELWWVATDAVTPDPDRPYATYGRAFRPCTVAELKLLPAVCLSALNLPSIFNRPRQPDDVPYFHERPGPYFGVVAWPLSTTQMHLQGELS